MQLRSRAAVAAALLTTVFGALAAGPAAAQDGVTGGNPAVVETLEANPGSTRIAEDTVLLDPDVMVTLPSSTGDVQQSALRDCPRGWLCAWPHSDFVGPMLAVRDGVYIDYRAWHWDSLTGAIYDCRGGCSADLEHWRRYVRSYAHNISSIYNNTATVTWAPFWSPRNGANYYAANGGPAAYVGDKWNDSFTAACAC